MRETSEGVSIGSKKRGTSLKWFCLDPDFGLTTIRTFSKECRHRLCGSLRVALDLLHIELQYSCHRVGVFFAGTDYGLQGATEPKLIVSAARKPFKPAVDMEGFYVFVSRVRRFADLRVLELPSRHTCFYKRCNCPHKSQARLDNLLELRHDPELQVWSDGYDANGDWSDKLARRTAGWVAAARAEAKQ